MNLETFKNHVLPVKDKLYRFALRYLKDEEEAQDIVQEVLIKVWNKRDQLSGIKSVEAWCMTITRNMSLDRLKSSQMKYTDSIKEGFDLPNNETTTPYHKAEMSDVMKNVNGLIQSLPDKQKQIIQLRDIEGFSYKEIAKILSIDMNQVKVNLFRARQYVKENLINISAYGL